MKRLDLLRIYGSDFGMDSGFNMPDDLNTVLQQTQQVAGQARAIAENTSLGNTPEASAIPKMTGPAGKLPVIFLIVVGILVFVAFRGQG